ncbi:MAG: prolyl oligopeptidase family serine peptidase [Chloroflexi bacterium]|nr:prolyl oligopeptidase family serine peptidase [Chloroflexota bacterium]
MNHKFHIESLLSARLFLIPQIVGDQIYFVSDLSGRLNLYAMRVGGSVPEPLLPPNIALQSPHHLDTLFYVFPKLDKILVMIDQDGDENYQPMLIPLTGGLPEPLFGDRFANQQVMCVKCDTERNLALFSIDPRHEPIHYTIKVDLATRAITDLGSSAYGNAPLGANADYSEIILADGYTVGDVVLYRWQQGDDKRQLLLGKPLEERHPDEVVPLSGIGPCEFTPANGLLFITALFDDQFSLGYLHLTNPSQVQPVEIAGAIHTGAGELVALEHRVDDRYTLTYNIDGVSWVYEGVFNEAETRFRIERVLCGERPLANGVLESIAYEKQSGRYAVAFSTATTPSQLYIIEKDGAVHVQTNERVLGIDPALLSPGEDASYTSFDGTRVSARLYLPAPALGYTEKRPVIFYIHGGPQSQERPDFTWFSMPLIQFFTLNGFAVFVPNVRGSTGYGMNYVKQVDHDWGGQDRLDHLAAFERLRKDTRLEMNRAGVMGRSYGGYMTLTLAGRNPELWKAACDMFGPYNMFTFMERIPETWKTYFYMAVGHPEKDKDFLTERSPSTYLHKLACPLFVIQGANDPRVVEQESQSLVENLRSQGKQIDYLVFEDEGHDILKYKNKVACYNQIVAFFAKYLGE